jgi:hypothetical protein
MKSVSWRDSHFCLATFSPTDWLLWPRIGNPKSRTALMCTLRILCLLIKSTTNI